MFVLFGYGSASFFSGVRNFLVFFYGFTYGFGNVYPGNREGSPVSKQGFPVNHIFALGVRHIFALGVSDEVWGRGVWLMV